MDSPAALPAQALAAPLAGKRIFLGVGGGVAAYKAVLLLRALVRQGAEVRVAMTPSAKRFVGKATFAALSGRAVRTSLWHHDEAGRIAHIFDADTADLIIVAPATAGLISRLRHGAADDAVTATVLASTCPVLLAPAMNVNMWQNPLTAQNVHGLLALARFRTVGPDAGFLACQWTGQGRMAEPDTIVEAAATMLTPKDLLGRRVLISAGPTFEAIDPVRFIGNRSSGKMGLAIARAFARRGASVTVVAGPTAEPLGQLGVAEVIQVESAHAMAAAITAHRAAQEIIVMCAAVADFRPAQPAKQKLKRGDTKSMSLALVANPDILAGLGAWRQTLPAKRPRPLLVGFAAETNDVVANGRTKLKRKQCDVIVANDVSRADIGFGADQNEVTMISAHEATVVGPTSKDAVAHAIANLCADLLNAPRGNLRRSKRHG